MRQHQGTSGFNKEKLIFLGASLFCAFGLYNFLATAPVQLEVGKPISAESEPAPMGNQTAARPYEVAFYIAPGEITRLIDPRTNQLVRRDRKTPFAPKADFVSKTRVAGPALPGMPGGKETAGGIPPPPPPPPPPGTETKEKKGAKDDGKPQKEVWRPEDRKAQVDYVGVVTMGGQSYGLLKSVDGGSPLRVKVGDKIAAYDYTVTRIDKQAIWVVDKDNLPFMIRDTRFTADAGASTGTDGGDGQAAATKKDAKTVASKDKKTTPDKTDAPADPTPPDPKPDPKKKFNPNKLKHEIQQIEKNARKH